MKKIILIAMVALGFVAVAQSAAPGTYFVKQIIDARTGDSYYITQSSDVILGKQIDLSNGDSYYVGTSTGAWPVSVYNSERLGGEPATNYALAFDTTTFASKLELDAETTARITADNAIAVDTATLRTDLTTLESDTATRFDAVAVDTVTIASDLASLAVSVAVDTATLRADLNTEIGDRVAGDNALGVSTGAIAGDLTAHTGDSTIHFTTGDIEKTTFTVLRAYEIKTSTITGLSPVYIPEMRSDSLKFSDDTELTTTAGLVSTTTAAATYLPKAGGTMTGDLILDNTGGAEEAEIFYIKNFEGTKVLSIKDTGAFNKPDGYNFSVGGFIKFRFGDDDEATISDENFYTKNIIPASGKTVDGRDISADGIKLDAVSVSTASNKALIDTNISDIADLSVSTANIAQNLADNYYTAVETDDKIRLATETISGTSLSIQEIDGSPRLDGVTLIQVSTGTLLINGTTATILTGGGGGGIAGVTSIIAGEGISVDQATGDVTITNTGGGGAGDPDIMFSYAGDIYNSTSPYVLNGTISKYAFTVASYSVDIGSATSSSFTINIATKTLGGDWVTAESFTVPVGVSSHTYTSSGYAIADKTGVVWGFSGVTASDPPGDIMLKIED